MKGVSITLRYPNYLVAALLKVVGLTHEMLGPNTPNLSALAKEGFARPMSMHWVARKPPDRALLQTRPKREAVPPRAASLPCLRPLQQ